MNRGKKQFYVCFAERAIILCLLVVGCAYGFLTKGMTPIERFILFGSVAAAVYYTVLFLMSFVRFAVGIGAKVAFNKPAAYFVIDNLTSVAGYLVAVMMLSDMILYWALSRQFTAGFLLIGTIAPLFVIVDWVFFVPHKASKCFLCCLIYPVLYLCIGLVGRFQEASVSLFLPIAIYAAVGIALYFVETVLDRKTSVKKIPYPLLWHDMPIDISSAFGKKEVAGSHGFLKTEGENFVFEDGTPVKFWGVNFNSAQNFPEHSHSEKVARRLARAGVNMVRLHQLDAEWASPNIFAFKRGKRQEDSRTFDEESLERLDYLIYCLKNEGIYIYLDFLTYRRFRVGDGVENSELLPEAGKPYCVFDRKMIELQKEYNRKLLTHVNKFTGVAYKDEPAIALAEVVNECDLLDAEYAKITAEPYRSQLLSRFRAYAAEKGVAHPKEDLEKRTDPLMREFLLKVQKEYVTEIIGDIRKAGGKFPMTAMNRESDRTVILTNGITDFSDSHAYWRGGTQSNFMNDPMSLQQSNVITRQLVTNAIEGKPFFVSEWDAPWPNEFRADVTLWTAAVGAFQNWSGFTLHTYRYGTAEQDYITEKLGRTLALGGSYSRGLFDCYNDPAKMGLFYHAALILRRGDVSSAKEKTVVSFTEGEYLSCEKERHLKKTYSPRYEEWKSLRFAEGEGKKELEKVPQEVVSDTGELRRNYKKGVGYIDSPRTQATYGFCHGENKLTDVEIDVKNDFATVAVSSLTDLPIAKTDNILLTAVGRADNTDCGYNFFHSSLKKEGRAPILADVIEATIKVKTQYPNMKVWAVNNEGSLIGQMKTVYDGEYLTFEIGKKFQSIYYLLQVQ